MAQKKTQSPRKSKLPSIDHADDIERYEAREEIKELRFDRCNHKGAYIDGSQVKCTCGAGWSGARLGELIKLLKGENG